MERVVPRARFRDVVSGVPRTVEMGRSGDPGRFPAGSVARVINAETRLLLGGPRALLLQLAEPKVAAGVADHSDFRTDPFGRLWNTLDRTLTVGYGDEDQAREAAAAVARTHATVVGERDGKRYRALDPALLTWVHATLVESAIVTYERFVGRVGPRAREAYVREMNAQAEAFGVPRERLWSGFAAFRAYWEEALARLRIGADARELGAAVLHPSVTATVRPVASLLALVTAGLLPPAVRDGYGLGWSPSRERTLRAFAAAVRASGPLLPDVARRWPHARAAERRVRATDRPVVDPARPDGLTPPRR